MKMSDTGRRMLTMREGTRLKAYRDSGGVWTIGVGHTGPEVREGMRITPEQSDALLAQDLARFERAVDDAVKVHVSQGQFDALVSLAFNISAKAFSNSTVVRKLNAGDIRGAGDAFLMWTHAGGKFVQGLMNRRQSERAQFLAGTNAKTR